MQSTTVKIPYFYLIVLEFINLLIFITQTDRNFIQKKLINIQNFHQQDLQLNFQKV